jgi:YfiH family protein
MTLKTIKADWPLEDKIKAFTTTRTGGVSASPYDSFNLALHVGDEAQQVKNNRILLREQLALPDDPKWLQQVHSKIVVNANDIESDQVTADAVYTDQAGIVCGVLTADCLPVALASKKGHCVGVAHAGWRGLKRGIIEETVRTMSAIAKPDYAWLGPAIGPQAFEVGADVYQSFVEQDKAFISVFTESGDNKWYLNIYQAASIVLQSLGIHKIYGGNHCTYNESKSFFSYRRVANTGRMATLIWLK